MVKQYGLREKMSFRTEVKKCVWRDDANRWLLFLLDLDSGKSSTHECQILFAATGQLIEPRPCDITGTSSFEGHLFHSARWDHSVDLKGKNVVIVGNGCKSIRNLWISSRQHFTQINFPLGTAAQIVPAIVKQTKSLTQVIRSKHWVLPAVNFTYPKVLTWIFRYVPFTMKLHRFHIFLLAEKDFLLFPMTKAAARLRAKRQKEAEKYMRDTAPAKYHQNLIPDFDIGCKVRVYCYNWSPSLYQPLPTKIVLTLFHSFSAAYMIPVILNLWAAKISN